MKCKYKFPAVGSVRFQVGISLNVGDHTYEIEVENERVSHISVTVPDFPPEFLPSITPLVNQLAKAHILIPDDPFRADIVANIRAIEGGLCLWGLEEIDTEASTLEWIPENDEERGMMGLLSFSIVRGRGKRDKPPDAQLQLLARTIAGVSGLKDFEVPLNFFRRGKSDLREGRFIDAIYDFYFVLETMFANGKFHKTAVIKELCGSVELVGAIEYLKREINDPMHFPFDLKAAYQDKLGKNTTEEIISDIVEIRGFLHHHTLKRKDIWHPARQKEFRVDCIILLNICQHILSTHVMGFLFEETTFSEFLAKDVRTSDGQVVNWVYNE